MSRRFLTPPQLPSGASLPSVGAAGALFFKSDESKIYVHDGTTWVIAQGSGGGGGGVIVSDTAPADPDEGTYWFDSTTTKSYIYYDGFWVEVGYSGGGYIISETAPANPTAGDVWFSTSEGVIYVYYDGFWVDPTTGGAAGVPVGGLEGYILAKASDDDYDTAWIENYTPQVKHTVLNTTGSTLLKGRAVYISGANGTNMLVSYASNAMESTSSKTLGILAQDITNLNSGFVVTEGLLDGLNTSTAIAGDPVWLGTSGQLLFGAGNKPMAPAHSVYLGVVTRKNSNNGTILVKVQNGYELNELHDVNAGSPSTNDVLQWNGTAWVNADVVTQVTSAIVDSAPATLDTLNELAAALGDDANFATTVAGQIAAKQDKVSGVSDTEIGYLDGVTSAIQTQLNGKAAASHTHAISDVTNLQTSLDAKANVANPTFTGVVSGNASATAAAADAAKSIGFKGIPASGAGASGAYTLVAADAGELVYSTSTRTVTIPSNASVPFEIGTSIVFISGAGATTTIAITSDTLLLAGQGTTGSRTLAAHGMATAVKVAATTWYISGNGLT